MAASMALASAFSAAVVVRFTKARGTPNSSDANGLRLIQRPEALGTLVNGQTRLNPSQIDDIALLIEYAID